MGPRPKKPAAAPATGKSFFRKLKELILPLALATLLKLMYLVFQRQSKSYRIAGSYRLGNLQSLRAYQLRLDS
jgi:hypothetical protein